MSSYDELLVQEQTGGSPSANLLTRGVDELFSRSDSSGSAFPITDALGSVVALTDSPGAVATQYTYEPSGETTESGPSNSNPSQYTGRENDGTGLYYYRARYYSPTLQRFIREDPIGLSGGINLYAYVRNDPISLRDPFGLQDDGRDWSKDPAVAPYMPSAPPLGGRKTEDSGGGSGDGLGGALAVAGCVAVLDSPALGPADAIALGILGLAALYCAMNPPKAVPVPDTITFDPKRKAPGPCEHEMNACIEWATNPLLDDKTRAERVAQCLEAYKDCTTPGGIPVWPHKSGGGYIH